MQTPILPVTVFPGIANTLALRPVSFGVTGPSYLWELQSVKEISPFVPAVAGTDENPETPAVPAEIETVTLANGNVSMTEKQWNAWTVAQNDEDYQLDCVCETLGLTRTK